MKISDRDRKILYIVAAIAVIFCGWFFGYRNIDKKTKEVEAEITDLKNQYNELKTMEAQVDTYRNDTMKYEANYKKYLRMYDNGYSQEHSIMFVKDIELSTGAWINQLGMAQTENIYTFGQPMSTNPRKEGQTAYQSDYLGYRTTLTLAYQASYKTFEDLIDFINSYKSKCTIDSMSMTYNADGDVVSGSLVVSQYCVTGSDRPFNLDNYGPVIYGTENIFKSDTFIAGEDADKENGNNIISDYDYYMSISPEGTVTGTVSMSANGDVTGKTTASTDENATVDAYIRFFNDGDECRVQYSIGDAEYPEYNFGDGEVFIPGDDITLLILSTPRTGEKDNVTVNATIVNETKIPVSVKVINDDTGNPRFKLKDATGEVKTYK